MIRLIDSHCHIDASEFDADRDDVIERARATGVDAQVVPAVTAASWPALRELCKRQAGLHPAYGLHPIFLDEHRVEHLAALRDWLERESPVAVGECGLDFWHDPPDRDEQHRYFTAQLELAKEYDLPVILHARKAYDDVAAAIRHLGGLRGVVHSFSGSQEQAKRFWDLGFHLGIGGPITYERAKRLRGIVANMPIEFLLLETDSPDQPLAGRQGRRNEPAYLRDVVRVVAELRGAEETTIAAETRANTERLFNLPSSAAAADDPAPSRR